MSKSTLTRSTLSIDAIGQAAARGGLAGIPGLGKITAIAGLAGFVLRLFRRSVAPEGSPKASRTQAPGKCRHRPPARRPAPAQRAASTVNGPARPHAHG